MIKLVFTGMGDFLLNSQNSPAQRDNIAVWSFLETRRKRLSFCPLRGLLVLTGFPPARE
ncbi:MAG: hypothetical protein Q7T18_05895 [Sedimentisphaerales bacterium]|nr:hypothetical protein [Sedimentisphaerales bacterium]